MSEVFECIEAFYSRARRDSTLATLTRRLRHRTLMTGAPSLAASRLATTDQVIRKFRPESHRVRRTGPTPSGVGGVAGCRAVVSGADGGEGAGLPRVAVEPARLSRHPRRWRGSESCPPGGARRAGGARLPGRGGGS